MQKKLFVGVLLIMILFSGMVLAALDDRFVDLDQDLVADLPLNESEWLDPNVLLFSYTPVEDPATYRRAWADFIEHLEDITGKRVHFYTVESYAAQLEALMAGRLHVAGVNTGGVVDAVNSSGFVPFAIMANQDGEGGYTFGYEMEIIVKHDSDIQSLDELRGKELALVSPTSNSGFRAPTALLKAEFGLEVNKDYQSVFTGRHDNSILGVINEDYEIAAIANSILDRMHESGVIDKSEVRSIYTSQTFPTTGYGHVHNLHPALVQRIKKAFFTFNWEGTSLGDAFQNDIFMPITYKEHWQVIRTINAAASN